MFINKKAISSYIVVLLFSSAIMTIILFPLLGTIYADDNILCQQVKYEKVNMCKKGGFLNFNLKNTGTIDISTNLVHSITETYVLKVGDEKKIKSYVDKSSVEVIPSVSDGLSLYQCKSKSETIKMELMPLC